MSENKRKPPRTLTVIGSGSVTPNMFRVTLGGPGLDGFPEGQDGGYVKFQLPPLAGSEKPTVRTYTIRAQRSDALDIDFALHSSGDGGSGPATDWALSAQPGDLVTVGGPGPAKPLPSGAQAFLVAGDMAALPAISANLAALPADARGIAVLEVVSEEDIQDLAHPAGFEIRWIVNPEPGSSEVPLATAVRATEWPAKDTYAWVACEFSTMRALRTYLLKERGLGRDRLYISSYWKRGDSEDSHRVAKRADAESAGV